MECVALCTASAYEWKELGAFFRTKWTTSLYKNVLYVSLSEGEEKKDLFVFPYGSLVFWNVSVAEAYQFLENIRPYERDSLQEPEEDSFTLSQGEVWSFSNDIITLTGKTELEKLAFSQGIAQSVKLGSYEERTGQAFEKNRYVPETMARDGNIPLSRRDIRKKLGQLFLERSSINLHMDMLDTPEFFWEHPEYEKVYELTAVELDLKSRNKTLNQQLDVINDLFAMLGEELNNQHSSRLEWAIIWLIVIEVVILLAHDIFGLI